MHTLRGCLDSSDTRPSRTMSCRLYTPTLQRWLVIGFGPLSLSRPVSVKQSKAKDSAHSRPDFPPRPAPRARSSPPTMPQHGQPDSPHRLESNGHACSGLIELDGDFGYVDGAFLTE